MCSGVGAQKHAEGQGYGAGCGGSNRAARPSSPSGPPSLAGSGLLQERPERHSRSGGAPSRHSYVPAVGAVNIMEQTCLAARTPSARTHTAFRSASSTNPSEDGVRKSGPRYMESPLIEPEQSRSAEVLPCGPAAMISSVRRRSVRSPFATVRRQPPRGGFGRNRTAHGGKAGLAAAQARRRCAPRGGRVEGSYAFP